MRRPDWRSLHVHYHDQGPATDRLITEAIAPAVAAGVPSKEWFFVRYWDGGPHVRVRLRAGRRATAEVVSAISAWLAVQPGRDRPLTSEAFYTGGLRATADWRPDRDVVPAVYEPETARYGGPAGLELSEAMFVRSSEIAVAALRAAPSRAGRLTLALDLLHAFTAGLGMDEVAAAAWLRNHAVGMAHVSETGPPDLAAMVPAAEHDLDRDGPAYARRRAAVLDAVARGSSGSLHAHWSAAAARALAAYRQADGLAGEPLTIMTSQLHMFHNRLGLSIAEECYLALLASATIAAGHGGDYFQAGFEAADRRYHEGSKYRSSDMAGRKPRWEAGAEGGRPAWWGRQPGAVRLAPIDADLGADLGRVLLGRRSGYGQYGGALTEAEVSRLLGFAAGASGAAPPATGAPKRTYPSGGSGYPVRVHVLPRQVGGIRPAWYEYDATAHRLLQRASASKVDDLLRCSPQLGPGGGGPLAAADCPLWLVVAADLSATRARYGQRAYRLVLLEAGHLAQNVCLVAHALGLKTIPLASFYDDLLAVQVGIDGIDEVPLYLLPLAPR